MRATDQPPHGDRLPYSGQVVWLSRCLRRAAVGPISGGEVPDIIFKTRGASFAHPTGARWKQYHGGRVRSRSFLAHEVLTPIYGIVTAADAPAPVREAAAAMREAWRRQFGVVLPVNPATMPANADLGNAVLLGDAAAATGRISRKELAFAGPEGFIMAAENGRIAIAGPDPAGTAHGVVRYLADYGGRFTPAGRPYAPPLHQGHRGLLHELHMFDRPYFRTRSIPGGWRLMAQGTTAPRLNGDIDEAAICRMAASIKDTARQGTREVSDSILKQARASSAASYVAAHLLWDPFADTTRLVRECRLVLQ